MNPTLLSRFNSLENLYCGASVFGAKQELGVTGHTYLGKSAKLIPNFLCPK